MREFFTSFIEKATKATCCFCPADYVDAVTVEQYEYKYGYNFIPC